MKIKQAINSRMIQNVLIYLYAVMAVFFLVPGEAVAKPTGFSVRVVASTSAWDSLHAPVSDSDYDAVTLPLFASVEVNSSAGNGHGSASASASYYYLWGRVTGNSSGLHCGADGTWSAGFDPPATSSGKPFKLVPGKVTLESIENCPTSTTTSYFDLEIFDETTPAFSGRIQISEGGTTPTVSGDFSLSQFTITTGTVSGKPFTQAVLDETITITVPAGHTYSFNGQAGGAGSGSSVDAMMYDPYAIPPGTGVNSVFIASVSALIMLTGGLVFCLGSRKNPLWK